MRSLTFVGVADIRIFDAIPQFSDFRNIYIYMKDQLLNFRTLLRKIGYQCTIVLRGYHVA